MSRRDTRRTQPRHAVLNRAVLATHITSAIEALEPRRLLAAFAGDPDDAFGEAIPLPVQATATTVTQSIEVSTDVDLYQATLYGGITYQLDIDASDGLDAYLRLFDAAGTPVAANNDGPTPGEAASSEPYLEFTPADTGEYFVGVSANNNAAYDPFTGDGDANTAASSLTGGYALNLTFANTSDPADQIAEAAVVGTTGDVAGAIGPDGVYLVGFDVPAAGRVETFDVDLPTGSSLDSYVRLFDAQGNPLAAADDAAEATNESAGNEAFLEYAFAAPGRYYVGVSAYPDLSYDPVTGGNDVAGAAGGGFVLRLRPGDRNDDFAEAATLTVGTPVNATLAFAADVDTFAFAAAAGQVISGGLGSDPRGLQLFDAAGNPLAVETVTDEAPNAGPGANGYFEHRFVAAGTYYARVTQGAGEVGDYTLSLNDGDGNNTIDTAATPQGAFAVRVQYAGDVDVFRVDLGEPGVVSVGVGTVAGVTPRLELLDELGTVVATNAGGSQEIWGTQAAGGIKAFLEYKAESGGTFYFRAITNGVTGAFTAFVSTQDENAIAVEGHAVRSAVGRTTAAAWQFGGDADTYQFDVAAGQVVGFDLDTPALPTGKLTLRDAAGNVLAASDNSAESPLESPSAEPFLEYSFAANGVYFVTVDADDATTAGAYTLRLTDGDPNDRIVTASLLNYAVGNAGQIAHASDVDLYRIDVPQAGTYSFDVDAIADAGQLPLDSYLRLFDAAGNPLAASDDTAGPDEVASGESFLRLNLAAGTYYVGMSNRARPAYNAVTGADGPETAGVAAPTGRYTQFATRVGDMNGDGAFDNLDIAPFVQALTDPAGYAAQYNRPAANCGDVNGDGAFNNLDIAAFVALLTGGGFAPNATPAGATGTTGGLRPPTRQPRVAAGVIGNTATSTDDGARASTAVLG